MIFLFVVIVLFIALAVGFAAYLITHDRGEHEPVGALWIAFALGFVGIFIAIYGEQWTLPDPTHVILPLPTLALVSLGIGVIEEVAKALPLTFFLYRKRYFNEHTDGVIYYALAGLGFGLPENILYTLQEGAKTGVARVVLTPLFHAATTAIIGYALARVKVGHAPRSYAVKAIILAIVAHALYDFGLFSHNGLFTLISIMTTAGLTVNIFVLFLRAKHLDEQLGLSAVGHNSFCRNCGQPNPKHNLYCVHCSNRA